MPDHGLAPPPAATGWRRVCYVGLGFLFLGLAVAGALLPLLPTTPFLLLASYFFVRSSPALHAWLLRSRLFGGFLRDWQRHRGVRPRVKVTACTMIPVVVFCSAYFGNLPWYLVVMLLTLAAIGLTVVIRLPTVRDDPAPGLATAPAPAGSVPAASRPAHSG